MPFSVLVTGANRGIGLELTRQLAASHSADHVFATSRNTNDCQDLKDLQKKHKHVHILQLEVCDESSYPRLVREVQDVVKGAGLNLLINNAGIARKTPLAEVTSDEMVQLFNTNSVAPLMLSKAFLPLLRAAAGSAAVQDKMSWRRAAIVNISTKLASMEDNSSGGFYSYRASKAALNMVTRSLGIDLRPEHILAVTLEPGWVRTDMGSQRANTSPEECAADILSTLPKLGAEHSATFIGRKGDSVPW